MKAERDEFARAADAISDDPCAVCGERLGADWTTVYNDSTERQERVHDGCRR